MLKLFLYDNIKNEVIVNEPDVLLIKEFADLWTNDRNKTKKDPTGEKKSKAFRELQYIFLAIDWKSPYSQYIEQDKHIECLKDSGLTDAEFDDETFRVACRKYIALQETSIIGSLLKTYYNSINKIRITLENIDYNERDDNGKPIFKTKDVMSEMANAGKMIEGIKSLEQQYKKELEEESQLRGSKTAGLFD